MPKISAVILAAGRSTRMMSSLPKVLHPVCGRPLVTYPVREAKKAGADPVVLVISKEHKPKFEEVFGADVVLAVQQKQLGTGNAVASAKDKISTEYVLVIPGDVPLLKSETLKKFIKHTIEQDAVCGVMTMELSDPAGYGRIVRDSLGNFKEIIEAKDAEGEKLFIKEVNSGIYLAKVPWVFKAISSLTPVNAQREYYLTDIVKIAAGSGLRVSAWCSPDSSELLGVNTRKELAYVNRLMRFRILDSLMAEGVGILDESNTYIDDGVRIGADSTVAPNCFIGGVTKIGKGCVMDAGVVIKNMVIGDNVHIKPYSVLEDSVIKNNVQVGPFARLRPGVVMENDSRIGNFVEIKKSVMKKGAKANHLSYIGDAVVGARTNVGCGTITCNYDGVKKNKTIIGEGVFVGSDVQFVAPVKIGRGATIGAGSTITEDVPANSLAVARGRQVVKKGWRRKEK